LMRNLHFFSKSWREESTCLPSRLWTVPRLSCSLTC
jgi:hypothetical protein